MNDDNLIERVERLMGPDRAVDWEIHCRKGMDGVGMYGDHPPYTGSMDAAMTLLPEPYMINRISDFAFDGHLGVELVAVNLPDVISFGTISLMTAFCAACLIAENNA